MRYLHTMLRVRDLDAALDFFVEKLGLARATAARRARAVASRSSSWDAARRTIAAEIELTCNWDQKEPYPAGRFFGHLAFQVDDIYATCERCRPAGVAILRPPRDGAWRS